MRRNDRIITFGFFALAIFGLTALGLRTAHITAIVLGVLWLWSLSMVVAKNRELYSANHALSMEHIDVTVTQMSPVAKACAVWFGMLGTTIMYIVWPDTSARIVAFMVTFFITCIGAFFFSIYTYTTHDKITAQRMR